jgi:hypothetical protein
MSTSVEEVQDGIDPEAYKFMEYLKNLPPTLQEFPIWKRQFLYEYGGFERTYPWNPLPQTHRSGQLSGQ